MAEAFRREPYLPPKILPGKISPRNPAFLRHADLVRHIEQLLTHGRRLVRVRILGESVEGRAIRLITLGEGPQKVLLWSQMHGDEPTHTAVLLDLAHFLVRQPQHSAARQILRGATLHMIPMLNPDGAEHFVRVNAQQIDINRDALRLQTPEGRILRGAHDELKPDFAFNLHDFNERRAVANSGKLASVALLVPPLDASDTVNEQLGKAHKLAGIFAQCAGRHCPGMVSRYEAPYMPHAFGEAMQRAGTATVLVEAGGWPLGDPSGLAEVHFLGLLETLRAIASGDYLQADPSEYDRLSPAGEQPYFDLLIRGARILNGMGHPPFIADVGMCAASRKTRPRDGRADCGAIEELGDLQFASAGETIDGSGLLCLPGMLLCQPDLTPQRLPPAKTLRMWLEGGVTTVIGQLGKHNAQSGPAAIRATSPRGHAINLGFVPADRLPVSPVHRPETDGVPIAQWLGRVQQHADQLGIGLRGRIARGAAAEVILARGDRTDAVRSHLAAGDVRHVVLNSAVVVRDGRATGQRVGVSLFPAASLRPPANGSP